MIRLRFWLQHLKLTLGKLCQQPLLLAGLALLCLFLPLAMGPAAQAALSRGISFSGLTLAITAPEEDPLPRQLEQLLSGMQDIRKYCHVKAMDYPQAIQSLEQGDVNAVLVLPQDFVQGVQSGVNPDVELILSGDRPLESLLTLWVGQSAAGLLEAVQSGIYAVLETCQQTPPAGLSHQDAMLRINMRYISWTMNRQDLYHIQQIPVTGQLPLELHYTLSLFSWLILAMAPLFCAVFSPRWLASQQRLQAVGIGPVRLCLASLGGCWLVESALFLLFLLALGGSLGSILLASVLCGLFCAAICGCCCLLTPDTGSCGVVSFVGSLAFLLLSGGIVPPVLMPGFLRRAIPFCPVTWLRQTMAAALGYEQEGFAFAALLLCGLVFTGIAAVLYTRRGTGEVAMS